VSRRVCWSRSRADNRLTLQGGHLEVVFLIAWILFGGLFIFSGLMAHLIGYRQGVQYARMYRVPLAELGVPLTGVMAVAGGLMVVVGLWGDVGALLIAAFLLLITPLMHAFWRETDEQQRQMQMANFTKNFALLGAALAIFYAFNQNQDVGLCLTNPLFGKW
jgi:putative oxidoreductase